MKSQILSNHARPASRLPRRQFLRQGLAALAGTGVASGLPGLVVRAATNIPPASSNSSRREAVATVHPEADAAALRIFRNRGNAVDAAVAAAMALCVVAPGSVGFGGYGGSMVIYQAASRRVTTIDFDSRAPLEFRAELYPTPEVATHGYLAAGVPGVVAGFDLALKHYGTLPWRTVSEPAVDLAEQGFPVSEHLSRSLQSFSRTADADSVKALFTDGKVPEAGEQWKQKDLAALIRAIGEGGAEVFYRGDIARKIVRQVRAHGGILSEADFASFKAQEAAPLHIRYRGRDLYTPPPPSGGLTSLSILKTLEQLDLQRFEPWGAEYFHWFAEISKLCWAERFHQLGDPERVQFQVDQLLSSASAEARVRRIRERKVAQVTPAGPAPTHTVNVVVVDSQNNAVSLTATHGGGFGSRVAVPGLGLVLGHGMSRFTLEAGSPNFPAPGKRMQHNMSPLLVLGQEGPAAVLGLPGGRMIVTVTAQLAVDLIDFRATAEGAVNAPRLHTEGSEPLLVSRQMPAQVRLALEHQGHTLKIGNVAAAANVVRWAADGTGLEAASGRALALEVEKESLSHELNPSK